MSEPYWEPLGGPPGPTGPPGGIAPTINAQVGTAYTLALGDQDNVVECANAAAITVTIPPQSAVAWAARHSVIVIQTGAGQVTIAAGAGVTLNSTPGKKIAAQWGAVTLFNRGTDNWLAIGNLVP